MAASIGLVLSTLVATTYWSTQKSARQFQAQADLDFQAHRMLNLIKQDLACSNSQGHLYQANPTALWIRRFDPPNSNGVVWSNLAGYRLQGDSLSRYEARPPGLPQDQPFPADPTTLQALWTTRPGYTIPSVSALQVNLTGRPSLEISLTLGSQAYHCKVDFQL